MVKSIVRDVLFLAQKSTPATKDDLQVGRDLMDTLQANRERCVGMAANMIGVKKNIINSFLERDIGVVLFPYDTDYKTVLDYSPNGLMITSGPGLSRMSLRCRSHCMRTVSSCLRLL